jgi:hypothetical protein
MSRMTRQAGSCTGDNLPARRLTEDDPAQWSYEWGKMLGGGCRSGTVNARQLTLQGTREGGPAGRGDNYTVTGNDDFYEPSPLKPNQQRVIG